MGNLLGVAGTSPALMSGVVRSSAEQLPPWRRSVLWLLFLGPFFFASYGFANRIAAERGVVDSLVFDWERHVPFLPWTILPYWSIDLFYGLSFLYCRDRASVDRHAFRLLTAQLACVAAFLLFPLHFSFDRPHTDGLFGAMFDALMGFDQPYNQAPSLHIALLVIIWVRFAEASSGAWRAAVHLWSTLIAVSVLTTFQHHFFDIPTGAAVGLFCLWLWPDGAPSPLAVAVPGGGRQRRLAWSYALAAALLLGAAVASGGWGLWLGWGALALAMVAAVYGRTGAAGFQKCDGRFSLAASLLFAPYLIGAWGNSRAWTWRSPAPSHVTDNVWLGRMPTAADVRAGAFVALFDLTAELPAPSGCCRYDNAAWLDLVPPSEAQLADAARRIAALHGQGRLLVCCALGYSRSACAVAAWLLASGRAADVDGALRLIAQARPQVVLGEAHRAALSSFAQSCREVGHG